MGPLQDEIAMLVDPNFGFLEILANGEKQFYKYP